MRKRIFAGFLILFFALILFGCPYGQNQIKPINEMDQKELAIFFNRVYTKEYDDYMNVVVQPNLTDEEKELLKDKKRWLTEYYRALKIYNGYVEVGTIPPAEIEKELLDLLNKL